MSSMSGRLRRIAAIVVGCSLLCAITASGASAASGPLKWSSPSLIDHTAPFSIPAAGSGISCPTATFCVSAGAQGTVKTSTNPTGGAGAWKVAKAVDQGRQLTHLSCPSTTLCAALDGAGQIVTSTNPAGGPKAWKATNLHANVLELGGISCPSASLCVAVGYSDPSEKITVETSTHPTGWSLGVEEDDASRPSLCGRNPFVPFGVAVRRGRR